MSQFIESIQLKDGQLHLLPYHEARMNRTRREVLGLLDPINLTLALAPFLHQYPIGLFKVRVLYDSAIDAIEFHSYTPRAINSLRLVKGALDYTYKTTDRQKLAELYTQRQDCDDILIVKDGFITDSYYANVAFYDGDHWYTPTSPLLKGVQRQSLLEQKIILPKPISVQDLKQYTQVKLFNAMMDWQNCPIVDTLNIYR